MKLRYQVRTLWDVIELVILANIGSILLLSYFGFPEATSWDLLLNLILFIFVILPNAVIFLRYYVVSRHFLVALDRDARLIRVEKSGLWKDYTFDDVKHVARVCAKRASERKNPRTRKGDFYHFSIELKSGEEIIITSLMTDRSDLEIGGKTSQVESVTAAWITLRGRKIINLASA